VPPPGNDRYLALVAILAGIMWSVGAVDLSAPAPERVLLLLIGFALLGLGALGREVGLATGLYAIAIGGVERLQREILIGGSDVLRATREAIEALLGGRNPYTHTMLSTDPIGSPFVYPPGEVLYYLLPYRAAGDIDRVETWAGILTIAALAVAGVRVGAGRAALLAMLYATWGIAAFRVTDGGNDVSAGFLAVVGLVALAFSTRRDAAGPVAFVVSAVALGWAVAFKQFAVILWPLVLRHLASVGAPWRRYALVSGGVASAMILPFFLWSPVAFVQRQADALTFHDTVWGLNVPNAMSRFTDPAAFVGILFVLEVALTAALLAWAMTRRIPTIGAAALIAAGILVVPLLLARWTTQSYYVYAATLAAAGLALSDISARPRVPKEPT
jgi:hypothetical protein